MRRIRTLGQLCLVAGLAMSALATSAAQASPPEYGQCVPEKHGTFLTGACTISSLKPHKGTFEWVAGAPPSCVPQKKGNYLNSTCTLPSVKPHKGKYERAPGPGFTSTATGVTFGEAPALGGSVTCAGYSDVGEITGTQTATAQLTYTGCEAYLPAWHAYLSCTTAGQPTDTIRSPVLDTILLAPSYPQVLTEFVSSSGTGGISVEFECTGYVDGTYQDALVQVSGEVAGVTTGDIHTMSATNAVTFEAGIGQQGLLTGVFGGPMIYDTVYEAHRTTTFASGVEIRP